MNPEYEAHERLCKSIGDMAKDNEALKQHVTELENRLRALWDKLEGERKFYEDRIKRLEEAGDALYEGWIGYGFTKDKHLAAWRIAKEDKL
jgi:hypothetical protein